MMHGHFDQRKTKVETIWLLWFSMSSASQIASLYVSLRKVVLVVNSLKGHSASVSGSTADIS